MTEVLIEAIHSDYDMFPRRGCAGYFGPLSALGDNHRDVRRRNVTYFEFGPNDSQLYDYTTAPTDLLAQALAVAHRPTSKRAATVTGFDVLAKTARGLHTLALPPISPKVGALDLSPYPNLVRLIVIKPTPVSPPWKTRPNLRSLVLEGFAEQDLSSLSDLSSLITLQISGARNLRSLDGIEALTSLKYLWLYTTPKLIDLSALHGCSSLKSIRIETAMQMGEPDDLFIAMPNLKSLQVPRVNGYRKYLDAPKLKFLSFAKDISLNSISEYFDDLDFLYRMDDEGEPQRMFWNTYEAEVYGEGTA